MAAAEAGDVGPAVTAAPVVNAVPVVAAAPVAAVPVAATPAVVATAAADVVSAAPPRAAAAAPAPAVLGPERAHAIAAPVAGTTRALAPGDAQAGDPAPPKAKRRRRGLGCLLLLLSVLVSMLALFTVWYMVNRKPVAELLPPIVLERTPHHLFSIYGVSKPMGVAVTPSGDRIFVTESAGEGVVRIFDRSGTAVGELHPPADGLPHAPVYLAVSPQDEVFVTDRATGAIYVYDAGGTYLRSFAPKEPIDIWQPLGIAFAPGGDLWVTDLSAPFHRVEVFGPDGTLKQTIGTKGSFDFPNAIAFDPAGNAYVSDSNNGRIQILDPSGVQISSLSRGIGADLGLPRGMAFDDTGRLYVVDATAQTVHLYRTDKSDDGRPRLIADIGIEGTGDGEFEYPNSVAADLRARIYVTDRENDRVQVWGY
jgi:sugar lactone lactonase YvrE